MLGLEATLEKEQSLFNEGFNLDKLERDKLRAEGRAEVRAEVLDAVRARAVDRARDRFGDRAAAETEARLAGVTRLARLLDALVRVGACDTEADLLATI